MNIQDVSVTSYKQLVSQGSDWTTPTFGDFGIAQNIAKHVYSIRRIAQNTAKHVNSKDGSLRTQKNTCIL